MFPAVVFANAPKCRAVADFGGDGKDDLAFYNNAEGNWYIKNSSTNTVRVQKFGLMNDAPIPFLRYP